MDRDEVEVHKLVKKNEANIYNLRQKSWDMSKFSPPPTFNVDNQVIFFPFWSKNTIF